MKIMVVDDKKKELEKAIAAVKGAGHDVVAIQGDRLWDKIFPEMKTVDGVITDLMFYPRSAKNQPVDMPPAGLIVVIHALAIKKPVVICTNAYEGDEYGHHGKAMSWIYDGYVFPQLIKNNFYPFGWQEKGYEEVGKNWVAAVEKLEKLLAGTSLDE